MRQNSTIAFVAAGALAAATTAAGVTTTFDSGTEGWSVSGRTDISQTGGNPGAHLDNQLIDVFGADIRNDSNPDFIGDLSRYGIIEFSIDIKINSIRSSFGSGEVPRDFGLALTDFDSVQPPVGVFFPLGTLDATVNNQWTTYSIVLQNPLAADLPAGWIGFGDEDPDTFEPILPADRTFASVLQNVDQMSFTTFVPGFFFGFTNFDIQVDNPTIRTVPAPAATLPLAIAAIAATRRRR